MWNWNEQILKPRFEEFGNHLRRIFIEIRTKGNRTKTTERYIRAIMMTVKWVSNDPKMKMTLSQVVFFRFVNH